MPIVSSEVINKGIQANGNTFIQYKLTDNLGKVYIIPTRSMHPSFDVDADLLRKIASTDEELIQSELSPEDKVPVYNETQADYYRRALGQAMLLSDIDDVLAYIPLFQAMENHPNSGKNAGQRANYLGVIKADYDLMAVRFGSLQGIAGGVATDKTKIWSELPEEWK